MAAKTFLVICASALFIEAISGQCIGNGYIGLNNGCSNGLSIGSGLGLSGLNYGGAGLGYSAGCSGLASSGLAASGLAVPSSGGALGVASASPVYPSGLSVSSENAIRGTCDVSGALPFVSVVALEGQMPSVGAAGVQYGCGNGNVGIVSDNLAAVGSGYGAGRGYRADLGYGTGLGYGAGLGSGFGGSLGGGCGCGC